MELRIYPFSRWLSLACRLSLLFILCPSAGADNWPNWRGPRFDGSTGETNLPASFSATENVIWKTALPGRSAATPIVWGDRIFLISLANGEKEIVGLCLLAADGKQLWSRSIAPNRTNARNTLASASPVTDGRRVIFPAGTGDLVAFDLDGNELWRRNIHPGADIAIQFGYSSSPLLYKDRLYVILLQAAKQIYPNRNNSGKPTESAVFCIDPGTGRDVWRQAQTDALEESPEAYNSPIPHETAKGTEIIVVGADQATGNDAQSGEELWRWGSYNPRKDRHWRLVVSPVLAGEALVICRPRVNAALAIRPAAGNPTTAPPLWNLSEIKVNVSTPLYYQNLLYLLDGDKRVMNCVDPPTGKIHWSQNISLDDQSIFRALPTGADGRIYCISEDGGVVVLKAGDKFEVVGRGQLGEGPCQSSIAAANGRLFIRTARTLYCVGLAK